MPRRHLVPAALIALATVSPAMVAHAAPDAARGQQLYARCAACHALTFDRVGPRHCGLLGRRAGSVPDFGYSPAMKRSGIVWDEATLDQFLTKPLRMVPGSSMTYAGVPLAADRADLIAYLKSANRGAACQPVPMNG